MILNYFKGKNFGDALNPMIFNRLLPNFFDNNPEIEFYGIGSIIGLDKMIKSKAKKKIIFSSGYGEYGKIPKLDSSYDIICVRGPLTAQALRIDKSLAIADGAILLKNFDFPVYSKKYDYSYMPHYESERKFDWEGFCNKNGIHYISPTREINDVLKEILETKVLLTEAMHGAIVADTLRVPWVPVKAYSYIREFKWQDWANSMKAPFEPNKINSMFGYKDETEAYLKDLSKNLLPNATYPLLSDAYIAYHKNFVLDKLSKQFEDLKQKTSFLSNDNVLTERNNQLLEKIELVKKKYA